LKSLHSRLNVATANIVLSHLRQEGVVIGKKLTDLHVLSLPLEEANGFCYAVCLFMHDCIDMSRVSA
jgi:hypothetical protein